MTDHPHPLTITVLVVDDQESVRALLRRQLVAEGHTVLEAGDGIEALQLVRRRGGALDILLSDVVMPGMNGTELAARVCEEFPTLPVILMSAYAPAGLARVGLGESIVPVLQKPFEPDQLAQLIQIAMEQPGGRRTRLRRASDKVLG
jgi:two-component system, cell cycle sensor histidine kinase and response regulator CckA